MLAGEVGHATAGWETAAALATWAAVVAAFIGIGIERWTYWRDRRDRDAA
jgi:hypothetical protein